VRPKCTSEKTLSHRDLLVGFAPGQRAYQNLADLAHEMIIADQARRPGVLKFSALREHTFAYVSSVYIVS